MITTYHRTRATQPTNASPILLSTQLVPLRSVPQVGLWSDDRPELSALDGPDQLAAVTAAAQDAGACLNCPAHAVCPSGPVLLPAPGYWHSSPNSPLVLRCPNSDACTYDDGNGLGDGGGGSGGSGSALSSSSTSAAAAGRRRLLQLGTATGSSNGSSNSIGAWDVAGAVARMGFNDSRSLRLALCQQLWYSTNPPGQAPELLQLLQPAALSTTPPQQPPLQPPALQQPPSSPSPSASSPAPQPQPQPLSQAQALQACVLWGLDPGSPLSYMSAQCAPGYAGHLCATCQPGFALSLDFQCSACPTTAQTVRRRVLRGVGWGGVGSVGEGGWARWMGACWGRCSTWGVVCAAWVLGVGWGRVRMRGGGHFCVWSRV